MDGIEEEQRAHPLVEVVAGAPETVERLTLGKQSFQRRRPAKSIQRTVADGLIRRGDGRDQGAHRPVPAAISRAARSSSMRANTSWLSFPHNARAICAISRP